MYLVLFFGFHFLFLQLGSFAAFFHSCIHRVFLIISTSSSQGSFKNRALAATFSIFFLLTSGKKFTIFKYFKVGRGGFGFYFWEKKEFFICIVIYKKNPTKFFEKKNDPCFFFTNWKIAGLTKYSPWFFKLFLD